MPRDHYDSPPDTTADRSSETTDDPTAQQDGDWLTLRASKTEWLSARNHILIDIGEVE